MKTISVLALTAVAVLASCQQQDQNQTPDQGPVTPIEPVTVAPQK